MGILEEDLKFATMLQCKLPFPECQGVVVRGGKEYIVFFKTKKHMRLYLPSIKKEFPEKNISGEVVGSIEFL